MVWKCKCLGTRNSNEKAFFNFFSLQTKTYLYERERVADVGRTTFPFSFSPGNASWFCRFLLNIPLEMAKPLLALIHRQRFEECLDDLNIYLFVRWEKLTPSQLCYTPWWRHMFSSLDLPSSHNTKDNQKQREFQPTMQVAVVNEIHKTKLNSQIGTHLFQRLYCNSFGVQIWIQVWVWSHSINFHSSTCDNWVYPFCIKPYSLAPLWVC